MGLQSGSKLYPPQKESREQLGSYSENPQNFRDKFKCLSLNFSLTWRDGMVILTQCCNDEEKARILDQARKVAELMTGGRCQSGPCRKGNPLHRAEWDPNTREGRSLMDP